MEPEGVNPNCTVHSHQNSGFRHRTVNLFIDFVSWEKWKTVYLWATNLVTLRLMTLSYCSSGQLVKHSRIAWYI